MRWHSATCPQQYRSALLLAQPQTRATTVLSAATGAFPPGCQPCGTQLADRDHIFSRLVRRSFTCYVIMEGRILELLSSAADLLKEAELLGSTAVRIAVTESSERERMEATLFCNASLS